MFFRQKTKAEPAPVLPATKDPMRVSASAAASIPPRPTPAQSSYVIPPPLPGVVPSGMAMDSSPQINAVFGYANTGPYEGGLGFLGYPYLAELSQRAEYRRMCEILAKEMTRRWIKLTAKGEEDKTERLAQIEAEFDRLKVQRVFQKIAEYDGFFGRGQIYLDTGDTENPEELAAPLFASPAKMKIGGLKAIRALDPLWTYPGGYTADDPLRADFYRPQHWFVMARKVHASRLLTFVSRELPDILKPAYQFGGLSLTQIAKPYVDNWLRTRQSVSDLLHSFSTMVLSTDMSTVLSGGGAESLIARAEVFNRARDNRGLMLVDKDGETLTNVSTPLGGLDRLLAQSQEQMASVAGIPLVVLLGITPSGLNASSDGEIRTFYAWTKSQQEHLFRPNLKALLEYVQLSLFGDIDPDIDFVFNDLWETDAATAATIRRTDAETASVYIAAGVLHPEEERKRLAGDDSGPYDGLDVATDPDELIDDYEDA